MTRRTRLIYPNLPDWFWPAFVLVGAVAFGVSVAAWPCGLKPTPCVEVCEVRE